MLDTFFKNTENFKFYQLNSRRFLSIVEVNNSKLFKLQRAVSTTSGNLDLNWMTINSMFADKAIGFLLFSGMIVLTVSRQSGIFRRFNSIRNIYAQKEVEGPNGDFVLRKARRNRLWRDFVSEDVGESNSRCEIEVKNDTGEILLFCWIMPTGKLRNFSVILDGSIKDNSCSNCHVEEAQINHAFVCIRKSKRSPKTLTEVSDEVQPLIMYSDFQKFS